MSEQKLANKTLGDSIPITPMLMALYKKGWLHCWCEQCHKTTLHKPVHLKKPLHNSMKYMIACTICGHRSRPIRSGACHY